jgi:hypothetical protein
MPLGVPFRDKHGRRGGQHRVTERSIAVKNKKKVRWVLNTDSSFTLHVPDNEALLVDNKLMLSGRKIRITKRNAQLLAEWITQMVGERVR